MNRIFRVIATGQWCAPMLSVAAGFGDNDGSAYADAVAVTLGLEAGALEIVDFEDGADPRAGELLEEPAQKPAPPGPPTLQGKLDAIMTDLAALRPDGATAALLKSSKE